MLSPTFIGGFDRLVPISGSISDQVFPSALEMIFNNIDQAEKTTPKKSMPKGSEWLDLAQLMLEEKCVKQVEHQRVINDFMRSYVNQLKLNQSRSNSDSDSS